MIRRRLAIFSPGGIGGGAFAQGLPALGSLVAGLAAAFDARRLPLDWTVDRMTEIVERLGAR